MSSLNLSEDHFDYICDQLKTHLSGIGLEHYPFKIGWYNQMVSPKFRLPFDDNCIAFVIISTPDMFELAFIPYLRNYWLDNKSCSDPIDECMKYHFNLLKEKLSAFSVEVIHDFELFMPNRRPRVLVQTAAHVSGAAFYYKPDFISDSTDISHKLLGVCIHPLFGGWFAIRGVIVFKSLNNVSLKARQPIDVIPGIDSKKRLLLNFNYHWKDWSYRDVIPVLKKYSDLQIKYFSLKPCERKEFINYLIHLKN
ncbi:cyanocobalamin reductase / alkylcobalamin dealkylase-like [Oppia nitens]|uniref:cyanocobalamin reductase / alkylcobalamin dealkylase-like n=1 Tax=Oppia nitens TaxID=1686743 RepID=UPI0023D9ADA7|nr:cyanocobalamin reductase / alkylcobalamin dealkylase-like [Oppia nitens]XP_054161448.1 cyanocobalamin reductase / alkylcobalamin dealkylase-like [Oppia nitens]